MTRATDRLVELHEAVGIAVTTRTPEAVDVAERLALRFALLGHAPAAELLAAALIARVDELALLAVTELRDAALLVVAHTRKSAAAHADDMAMGSRAFTGLARSVLHLMTDPDDESEQRRLLLPGKNNLAERPDGLAFDIGPGQAIDSEGSPRPCVRWHDGVVDITADDAVNREPAGEDKRATERDEAGEWLRQALAAGARPSRDVLEQAKETEGIAEKTLRRAMKEIGVDAYRPKNPGPWWWRLPTGEAHGHTSKGSGSGHLAICSDDAAKGVF